MRLDFSSPKMSSTKQTDGRLIMMASLLETRREAEQQKKLAAYRARLMEGPVLIFPVDERLDFSFDPNDVVVFDDTRNHLPHVESHRLLGRSGSNRWCFDRS